MPRGGSPTPARRPKPSRTEHHSDRRRERQASEGEGDSRPGGWPKSRTSPSHSSTPSFQRTGTSEGNSLATTISSGRISRPSSNSPGQRFSPPWRSMGDLRRDDSMITARTNRPQSSGRTPRPTKGQSRRGRRVEPGPNRGWCAPRCNIRRRRRFTL
jgi:hypothetical protein